MNRLKKHKIKLLLTSILTILLVIGWFVPFQYHIDGYSEEESFYRYKIQLSSCDWNWEAEPDFQCFRKVGDFWNYIGLKKIDSEFTKQRFSTKKKLPVNAIDTLSIINSIIRLRFEKYQLIDWEVGDINRDKQDDFVVVIDTTTQEFSFDNRIVLLIESIKKSPLKLFVASVNTNLIQCSDCGGAGVGDPYRGITIKNNDISFKQLFGACCKDEETVFFTFDAKLKNWFLLKKEKISYCCNNEENGEIKTEFVVESKHDFGIITFADY